MVRLREIPRTAAFTWSPGSSKPFLATGTRAGAVDADFSNDTQLELWDLSLGGVSSQSNELEPCASVGTDSRFHDIAWVESKSDHTSGIIAGALENGSLDLWDAGKLLARDSDAHMSRTSKHSGAIKTLQFNPFRSELLATAGAKGELYMSDLNNIGTPFRLGNAAGRADDFECLDWNKKVAHIMVTGSSGGFVTVWDVKTKKESLTLNNLGRKPISAVAWDPEKPTRLITAVPLDTDPLILVWDLRNSNAPEKVLRGHEGGVLSLSWCQQDNDLLLSCGKDSRTICWNPQSGEAYGEFPVVTNWTFQTRWNPHNPGLLATASFDGKIAVQTIQNTKPESSSTSQSAPLDGEDFFANASTQSQASSFTLPKAPKWLESRGAVSFGFGGRLVSISNATTGTDDRKSSVHISSFTADDQISSLAKDFSKTMEEKDLAKVCKDRFTDSSSEKERNDWKVIGSLVSDNPRKELVESLGFSEDSAKTSTDTDESAPDATNLENECLDSHAVEDQNAKSNRLSSFFDKSDGDDNFLANLASTKGAKTNNPFHIYEETESPVDKQITRALMLGQLDKAMEVCLKEDRLSDAFMIAVCGGQSSIEKVQQAYFKKQVSGPKYLRLLASVVGKNLWDIVYNADLENWKEVMATLCTYASSDEFPDLCECLGDRLEERAQDDSSDESDDNYKTSALYCYLAGSKLEKVVRLWLGDLEREQEEQLKSSTSDNSFSIHSRILQGFIEKVTVYRAVTQYKDIEQSSNENWKLTPLYAKYLEYAEIVAGQGQLEIASRYLDLLPPSYPDAEVTKDRITQATKKLAPRQVTQQTLRQNVAPSRVAPVQPGFEASKLSTLAINSTANPYAPPQNYYPSADNTSSYQGHGYQPPRQVQPGVNKPMIPPPPSIGAQQSMTPGAAAGPPNNTPSSKASNMPNWNDTPEDFFKPPTSRRGTPGIPTPAVTTPYSGPGAGPPPAGNLYGAPALRSTQPAPPPPKGPAPPPRNTTPASLQPPERPSSAAANAYAPSTVPQPVQQQHLPPMARGPSPYNAPPTAGPPTSGSRYAPAPSATPTGHQPTPPALSQRPPPPPNPYASRPNTSTAGPPPPASGGPPTGQSLSGTANAPPSQGPPRATPSRHPPGDRSHIPASALPIFELLSEDMQRVKAKAPASFKSQVVDTEKRLNILFDNLNNETLLKPNTIQDMIELATAIKAKNYERAQAIHLDIHTNRTDECGNWMTGVKRLVGMSKATP